MKVTPACCIWLAIVASIILGPMILGSIVQKDEHFTIVRKLWAVPIGEPKRN